MGKGVHDSRYDKDLSVCISVCNECMHLTRQILSGISTLLQFAVDDCLQSNLGCGLGRHGPEVGRASVARVQECSVVPLQPSNVCLPRTHLSARPLQSFHWAEW